MCNLTFVLGHGEQANICVLANWHKERTHLVLPLCFISNRCRTVASMLETLRTGYLHPLDGLDRVVGDMDVDANGLAVVVQLERE